MEYRAVGKRCGLVLESLHLPLSPFTTIHLLQEHGFSILSVDTLALARSCIGNTEYRRGSSLHGAPQIVDCSSFIKWLFGQRGVWMPRLAIQQRHAGEVIDTHELRALDLVFTSNGHRSYYDDNPNDGVGHVGLVTDTNTIIHATQKAGCVVEIPLQDFIGKKRFRGARRYFPIDREFVTLLVPEEVEIETADDIRYFVLRQLPREQWQ